MASIMRFALTGDGSPSGSTGGQGTDILLSENALNNLFQNVDPALAASGGNRYRAIDIVNIGDSAAKSVKFFLVESTSPDTSMFAGADSTEQSIPNDSTEPSGVVFSQPTELDPIIVDDIPPGGRHRLWILMVVHAGAANMTDDTTAYGVISG